MKNLIDKFLLQPNYVIITELWLVGICILIGLYSPLKLVLLIGTIGTIFSIASLIYYFLVKYENS